MLFGYSYNVRRNLALVKNVILILILWTYPCKKLRREPSCTDPLRIFVEMMKRLKLKRSVDRDWNVLPQGCWRAYWLQASSRTLLFAPLSVIGWGIPLQVCVLPPDWWELECYLSHFVIGPNPTRSSTFLRSIWRKIFRQ